MASIVGTLVGILNFILPQSFMGVETGMILYFLIFVVSIYFIYRFLKLAFKAGLIFVSAGLFPVLANYVFGIQIPITVESILSYAFTGLFVYLAGYMIKSFYGVLKALTWPFRKLFGKSEEERIEERVEKELEEKD